MKLDKLRKQYEKLGTEIAQLEDETNKDWRHAFAKQKDYHLTHYSGANAIKIKKCNICNRHRELLAYVTQFINGGFWLCDGIMYVVTSGMNSDPKATYANAKAFIADFKE